MGRYKKEKKANNPASQKNEFIPGGDASRADVPFSFRQSLDPQLFLGQKSLRSQLCLKRLQPGGVSSKILLDQLLGSLRLFQPFSDSSKFLLVDFNQGLRLSNSNLSSGDILLRTLDDDFRFL